MIKNGFAKKLFRQVAQNALHRRTRKQYRAFIVQDLNDVESIFYQRTEVSFTAFEGFLRFLAIDFGPETRVSITSAWSHPDAQCDIPVRTSRHRFLKTDL